MFNRFCLETLGLLPGVTIAGISVHTNSGHGGGFKNRGVTEVGIKTHQHGVHSCKLSAGHLLVAWFVTEASSLLPIWNPEWSVAGRCPS